VKFVLQPLFYGQLKKNNTKCQQNRRINKDYKKVEEKEIKMNAINKKQDITCVDNERHTYTKRQSFSKQSRQLIVHLN
jgi:hypothetical protein